MTITLRPEHERAIQQAIENGLIRSVDDLIGSALAALSHPDPRQDSRRQEAIQRMLEFGDSHRLALGEPITRQLLHEGHRY
jgi:hypothetical protein